MAGRKKRVGPVNYYELPRKQLQSLCKKYGFPANKTNLLMAEFLTAHLNSEEYLNRDRSLPSPAVKTIFQRPDTEMTEDGLPSIQESQPTVPELQARNLSSVFVTDDDVLRDRTNASSETEETVGGDVAKTVSPQKAAGVGPSEGVTSFTVASSGSRDTALQDQGEFDQETPTPLSISEKSMDFTVAGSAGRDPFQRELHHETPIPLSNSEESMDFTVAGSGTRDSSPKSHRGSGQSTPPLLSTSEELTDCTIAGSGTGDSSPKVQRGSDQETPLVLSTSEESMDFTIAGSGNGNSSPESEKGSGEEMPLPLSISEESMDFSIAASGARDAPPESQKGSGQETPISLSTSDEWRDFTAARSGTRDSSPECQRVLGQETPLPLSVMPYVCLGTPDIYSSEGVKLFVDLRNDNLPSVDLRLPYKNVNSSISGDKGTHYYKLGAPPALLANKMQDDVSVETSRSLQGPERNFPLLDRQPDTGFEMRWVEAPSEKEMNNLLSQVPPTESSSRETVAAPLLKSALFTPKRKSSLKVSFPSPVVLPSPRSFVSDTYRSDIVQEWSVDKNQEDFEAIDKISGSLEDDKAAKDELVLNELDVDGLVQEPVEHATREQQSAADIESPPEGIVEKVVKIYEEGRSRGPSSISRKDSYKNSPFAKSSRVAAELERASKLGQSRRVGILALKRSMGVLPSFSKPEDVERMSPDDANTGPVSESPAPEEVVMAHSDFSDTSAEASPPVVVKADAVLETEIVQSEGAVMEISGPPAEEVVMADSIPDTSTEASPRVVAKVDASLETEIMQTEGAVVEISGSPAEEVVMADSIPDTSAEASPRVVTKVDALLETEIVQTEEAVVEISGPPAEVVVMADSIRDTSAEASSPRVVTKVDALLETEIVQTEEAVVEISGPPAEVVMSDSIPDTSAEASPRVVAKVDAVLETEIVQSDGAVVEIPTLCASAAESLIFPGGQFQNESRSAEFTVSSIERPAEKDDELTRVGGDSGTRTGQQNEVVMADEAANLPATVEESATNLSWMTKPIQLPTRRSTNHKSKEKTGRLLSANGRKVELMERAAAGRLAKLKLSKKSSIGREEEEATCRPKSSISATSQELNSRGLPEQVDVEVQREISNVGEVLEDIAEEPTTTSRLPGVDTNRVGKIASANASSQLKIVNFFKKSSGKPVAENAPEMLTSLIEGNSSDAGGNKTLTSSAVSLTHNAEVSVERHEEELSIQAYPDPTDLVCPERLDTNVASEVTKKVEEKVAENPAGRFSLLGADLLQVREEKAVEVPPPKKVYSLLDIDFTKVKEKPMALVPIDSNRWAADTVVETFLNSSTPVKPSGILAVQDVFCDSPGKENNVSGKENEWLKRHEQHKTPLTGMSKEKALRTAEKNASNLREQLLRKRRGIELQTDDSDAQLIQSIQLSPLKQLARNRLL